MNFKNHLPKIAFFILGILFTICIIEFSLRVIGDKYLSDFKYAPIKTSHSKFKVLTLGNSYTFGLGAPPGKSYPDQLGVILNELHPDKFQVINKGYSNINSTFIYENLNKWVEETKPNLVFIMTGEPNKWNKYGFSKFLNQYYNTGKELQNEWYRELKIFRLYELLKSEFKKQRSFVSDFFLTKAERKILMYRWIGVFVNEIVYEVEKVDSSEIEVAVKDLEYGVKEFKNTVAARLLARIYLYREKNYEKAFEYIKFSIENEKDFKIDHEWVATKIFYSTNDVKLKNKLLALGSKNKFDVSEQDRLNIKKLIGRELKLEVLPRDEALRIAILSLNSMPESNRLRESVVKLLLPDKFEEAVNIVKFSMLNNPYAPSNQALRTLISLARNDVKKQKLIDGIFNSLNQSIDDFSYSRAYQEDSLELKWIEFDLERIVKFFNERRINLVIQNYPPMRTNEIRFADSAINNWVSENKNKYKFEFQDIGMYLKNEFGKDKEFYFSNQFGPFDTHLNEHGYKKVAEGMVPIVLKNSN